MKPSHNKGPDGVPDELFQALEAELPQHVEYLRRLRARLYGCESDAVNADTGLHTATAVATQRAIARLFRQAIKATRVSVPWWHWVAVVAAIIIVQMIAAQHLESMVNERTIELYKGIYDETEKSGAEIVSVVRQEAQTLTDANSWRVPHKITMRRLPAGTYQLLETNRKGQERWVTVEIEAEFPEWTLPRPEK